VESASISNYQNIYIIWNPTQEGCSKAIVVELFLILGSSQRYNSGKITKFALRGVSLNPASLISTFFLIRKTLGP
jgi:hypothetical protein